MKIIRTRDRATQLEHLAQAQQSAPSVNYSEDEWRERLTPQQYLVLRQAEIGRAHVNSSHIQKSRMPSSA